MRTSTTSGLPRFPWRHLRAPAVTGAALLLAVVLAAVGEEPPAPPAPPGSPAPPTSTPSPPAPAPAPATAPDTPPDQGAVPGTPANGRLLTGKISGTVVDSAKRPLAGVLVKLRARQDPGLLRVTSTDRRGQYLFKDLVAGVYEVRVEADEFRSGVKGNIDVKPPFQNIVDVSLMRTGEAPPGPGELIEKALGGAAAQAAPASGAGPADPAAPPALPPVAVRGRFVDSAGRPLIEVPVLLAGADDGQLYQAFSDDDGRFLIEGVVPGRYRIRVRSLGHVPIDLRSVVVLPESGLNLSLVLVDYALSDRGQMEPQPPPEVPRPLAGPPALAPPSAAPPAVAPGSPAPQATAPAATPPASAPGPATSQPPAPSDSQPPSKSPPPDKPPADKPAPDNPPKPPRR